MSLNSMLLGFILFLSVQTFADTRTELQIKLLSEHKPITYKQANEILFIKLNKVNGVICSVYSPSFCINSDVIPSPKIINIEHTWPQSMGAHDIAKSDLHHLFPATSSSNAMRSSLPFCNVAVIKWADDQSKRGYNEFNEHCFEPPADHKGNVARALFYFAVRYKYEIDQHQEFYLRQWHQQDPVDADEMARNLLILNFQNVTNPFIDDPTLVELISDF
jgi:deoxyribonuclease I